MTSRERRHLHVVPPLSSTEEVPEPNEPQDPEPPDDDFLVLLW